MHPCREFRRRKVATHPSLPLEWSRRDGLRRQTRLLQPMLNCKTRSNPWPTVHVLRHARYSRVPKSSPICVSDLWSKWRIATQHASQETVCWRQFHGKWPPVLPDDNRFVCTNGHCGRSQKRLQKETCQCFTSFFVRSLLTVCTPSNVALHTYDSVTFTSQQLTPNTKCPAKTDTLVWSYRCRTMWVKLTLIKSWCDQDVETTKINRFYQKRKYCTKIRKM